MIDDLLARNRTWAAKRLGVDPDFFRRLTAQQFPSYLWVGCSDSRVPANEIVGLDPGELFVHRNVANIAPPQDANFLSVLQYALEVLQVRHVIVCGHYGCGGVRAAISGRRHGLIDHWLSPIRALYTSDRARFDAMPREADRVDALCEANVLAQVASIADNPFVHDAWSRGQEVDVHGWIYAIHDGIIRDLGVTVTRPAAASAADDFSRSESAAKVAP